jgi:Fatty acid desaturase
MSIPVPAITDPQAAPSYPDSAFQRWVLSMIVDPRDAVFVRHTLLMYAVMVPLHVALFVRFSWWLALAVFVAWAAFVPRTILMLHNTMHRPFLKRARWLNRWYPYSMSLLFGIPTGYMEHHVGMHHAENNLRNDRSSTMRYQRDNPLHWLVYFFRFLFLIHFELYDYFSAKKRLAFVRRALISDFAHIGIMLALALVNPRATLVACVFPFFFVRAAMMLGNWGQHAFIDVSRPGDSYVNSITCINSPYNHRAFNDGYHIGHHVKQNRHWTEMPADFLANQERYLKEGCIVFEGLDFAMVALLLFGRQYGVLARKFVRMPGDTRTDAEIADFLRQRVKRIADDVPEGVVMNA